MNQYIENNGVLECIFTGRMDTVTSQTIDIELKALLKPEIKEIIFNLSEVEYLSSSFLRLCISSLRHTGKENFRVTNVTPTALMVFQIAGMTELLQIS